MGLSSHCQDLDEDLHQKIATEMNLSETAFIRKLHPTDDFTKSEWLCLPSRVSQKKQEESMGTFMRNDANVKDGKSKVMEL